MDLPPVQRFMPEQFAKVEVGDLVAVSREYGQYRRLVEPGKVTARSASTIVVECRSSGGGYSHRIKQNGRVIYAGPWTMRHAIAHQRNRRVLAVESFLASCRPVDKLPDAVLDLLEEAAAAWREHVAATNAALAKRVSDVVGPGVVDATKEGGT